MAVLRLTRLGHGLAVGRHLLTIQMIEGDGASGEVLSQIQEISRPNSGTATDLGGHWFLPRFISLLGATAAAPPMRRSHFV